MATKYIRFLSAEEADALPAGQAVMVAVAVDGDGEPTDIGGGSSYVLPAATTSSLGGVKMAAHVADAAGETPTAAGFNGLVAALEAAGILSAS